MNRTPARSTGSTPAQNRPLKGRNRSRLFRLDGGYIVLDEAAAARGRAAFEAIAALWPDCHVTAITGAPPAADESMLAELGRAAQAFDRVVICASCHAAQGGNSAAAARLARAVRRAGRTECHVVADAHRALRHCIDAMVPGEVVAYCCEDVETAARILAEYGAEPVGNVVRRASAAAATRSPGSGATGELTAAHI